METIFKRLEDDKIELSVTIPADEVDKAVKDSYAVAADNRIKGFRKGKAPRSVLDKVFGGPEYFLAEATDELIKASYLYAIDGEGFVPLDTPDMSSIEPAVEGESYTYSFTFTVEPDFELSSYEPVEIELPSDEPTAEEIQSRVDTMLGYYAEFEEVTDRPSQSGDTLMLDMTTTHDGERVDSLSGDTVPFEIGVDDMPEAFTENLTGVGVGDEVSFDFQLPFFDDPDEGEQDLHVEATVKGISVKVLPELTDEWVQERLDYESAEVFRQLLTDSLKSQKQANVESLKQHRIADAIADRLLGDPPEILVSEVAQDIYNDIFLALQKQGVTLDAYLASSNQDADEFRESVQSQALTNARQSMALDAWARHYGLVATDEDIRTEFERSETDDIDATIKYWEALGRMSELRRGILRMKAANQLGEEALITEEKPVENGTDDEDANGAEGDKGPEGTSSPKAAGDAGEGLDAGSADAADLSASPGSSLVDELSDKANDKIPNIMSDRTSERASAAAANTSRSARRGNQIKKLDTTYKTVKKTGGPKKV
ncbi:MAG: trigger factor [Coriobacteriia bacterium]|nr:trigger factor [Coriobacteriia bacterium]